LSVVILSCENAVFLLLFRRCAVLLHLKLIFEGVVKERWGRLC